MKVWSRLVGAILLTTAVAGCSDDNPTSPFTSPARVQAVHASPDAPDVDLLVDDVIVADTLAYPNSTGYLDVTPGTRNVKVNLAGTHTTAFQADLPVVGGRAYSVFAIDSVASIEALVLLDTLVTPAAGQARVRFVHLSPNTAAVDIAITGGAVLVPNLTFRQASGFLTLDAGTYDLEIRAAGTVVVLHAITDVVLAPLGSYTAFVRGFAGGVGGQALGAQVIQNQ